MAYIDGKEILFSAQMKYDGESAPIILQEKTVEVTENGSVEITADTTFDGLSKVTVSVDVEQGITPSGKKIITENGTHDVKNYASAEVNVDKGITPSGTKTITENGTHDVTNYASAVVNVASEEPSLQAKNVEITANGTTTILPDSSYDGMSQVLLSVNVAGSSSDIELFAINFANYGNGARTAELTGVCVNTTYADWYAQSKAGNDIAGANKAIYNSGNKYIDTDLQGLDWHDTSFTMFILQKNVPFIIWRTSTTALSTAGLSNNGDMLTRSVDGTTYYGYVYTYSGTANNIILDGG